MRSIEFKITMSQPIYRENIQKDEKKN